MKIKKILFLTFLKGSNIIFGATYYVDNSLPDDNGKFASQATAKKTIQTAIDAAFNNNVILVKYSSGDSATYSITSSISISGKNIKLVPDNSDTGWEDAQPDSSKRIIDGNYTCQLMLIIGSLATNNACIRGFKFYRASGIYSHTSSVDKVMTQNVTFMDGINAKMGSFGISEINNIRAIILSNN